MVQDGDAFPRQERLRKPWEFLQVRQHGRVEAGRFLVVSVLRRRNEKTKRIGFIVSRHLGNAVLRNRIKRRLREIYRMHRIHIDTGIWLVLIARRKAPRASYVELEREFLQLYQSIMRKLLC